MRYDTEQVTVYIDEVCDEPFGQLLLREGLLTDNFYKILEEAQTRAAREDVDVDDFIAAGKSLYRRGMIRPTPKPVDDRPRDRNGRVMSGRAIQYRDWLAWVQDPKTSTAAVKAKAKTDPAFAEFYVKFVSGFSGVAQDGVQETGTARVDDGTVIDTPELREFANTYRYASVEQINTMKRAATNPSGADGAARFNYLWDHAIRAGLI